MNNIFEDLVSAGTKSAESIVEKVWGKELIQTNTEKYCLKYLVFYKGGKISRHFHKLKDEQFFILCGVLGAHITDNDGFSRKYLVERGDSIKLPPGTIHELECFENSVVVEVSSQDFVLDSFRLNESSFNPHNDLNIKNYQ